MKLQTMVETIWTPEKQEDDTAGGRDIVALQGGAHKRSWREEGRWEKVNWNEISDER